MLLMPRLQSWLGRSVRHKLLAMALLPLAVVLPLLLVALLVWSGVVYDRLLITKVRSDLAVANGYFDQVVSEVGSGTQGVAQSLDLYMALKGLLYLRPDPDTRLSGRSALNALLIQERERLNLDFLRFEPTTPQRPGESEPIRYTPAQLAVYAPDELALIAPHLLDQLNISLVPTRNAAPSARSTEDRAMLIYARHPVRDTQGQLMGWLHGGILLNQNLSFIDHINRIVYPEGSLPFGSQGTATLFLDDVRITTNVRLFQQERAIGTRVSQSVRERVLDLGQTWLDRAFVVDDWYVSAYQPLADAQGQRIGMLYVGYLEQPFRWVRYGLLALIALLFIGVMALAAVFSLRWAQSIFKPVQQMNLTMQAVEQGQAQARVGAVEAQDELGALANHLDALLDVVDHNTQRLQQWAQTLDHKVQERTRELELSNASLRKAQQQLVKSEKLAAIGQLTASIAHEINNPIAVMQGNLDLIRHELGNLATPIEAELKLLDAQIERMRLIVTQLLQYSRPTEFAGYVSTIDVNPVVQDCLVLVNPLLQQKQVQVHTDLQCNTTVQINRQELQQVVINLLINAIQAVPPQEGQVWLRSFNGSEASIEGACIEIEDNGGGLAPHIRERLFTPFMTTKNDGNGLGLWISQSLMERYGGKVEIAPGRMGTGACLRVCICKEPLPPA
jgi:two-component system, NtrC family, sensor kinase